MLISHNAAPSSANSFICNFDVTGSLLTLSTKLTIHLWVTSVSPINALNFKVFGCTSGQTCAAETDYNLNIPGGSTYDTYNLKVEKFVLEKNSGTDAKVTLNSGSVIKIINLDNL